MKRTFVAGFSFYTLAWIFPGVTALEWGLFLGIWIKLYMHWNEQKSCFAWKWVNKLLEPMIMFIRKETRLKSEITTYISGKVFLSTQTSSETTFWPFPRKMLLRLFQRSTGNINEQECYDNYYKLAFFCRHWQFSCIFVASSSSNPSKNLNIDPSLDSRLVVHFSEWVMLCLRQATIMMQIVDEVFIVPLTSSIWHSIN